MGVIDVAGLVKKFGEFTAVNEVSFAVERGEIFGFLGPNGAGKSTTIKMLATLLKPTAGHASLAGFDIRTQPVQVRQSIGLVFQDPSLDDVLTADENLRFHAMMYGVPADLRAKRTDEVLEMVDLTDRRRSVVKTFSGGMKRRLEIARGLLHHPKVLFLDEPTVGLDPQTRNAIWQHVHRLRDTEDVTIFMTTHYMDEAENCDRIAVIDHGHIVALDTPAVLKRQVGGDVLTIRTDDDQEMAVALAERYQVQVAVGPDGLRFQVKDGASFIPRLTADFTGRIRSVSVHQPTLDDVFLNLTGRVIREEEGSAMDAMRQHRKLWTGGRR